MPRWCRECGGPLDAFETRVCGACIAKGLKPEDEDQVCPVCGHIWNEDEYDG